MIYGLDVTEDRETLFEGFFRPDGAFVLTSYVVLETDSAFKGLPTNLLEAVTRALEEDE